MHASATCSLIMIAGVIQASCGAPTGQLSDQDSYAPVTSAPSSASSHPATNAGDQLPSSNSNATNSNTISSGSGLAVTNPNDSTVNTVDPNASNPNKTSSPTYTTDNLLADMTSVLQARSPIYSSENLGNPANVVLWTSDEIQSLYGGILVVQQDYFPGMALTDVAHMVVALGALESTGDYRLDNGATGYEQVSTNVTTDYSNHGLTIVGGAGVIATPGTFNLLDPGQSVVLWAWESRNEVSSGESANEVALGLHNGNVTPDFGNALLSWFCGPGGDRHALVAGSDAANRWPDLQNRLQDYFVQSGFGSVSDFTNLLDASVPNSIVHFKDAPAGAFPQQP